jgi:hypothetical protein
MTHTMKKGDLFPPLVVTLAHEGEEPLDLSTATVRFVMKARRGPVKVDRALVPAAISGADVTVDWVAGDTDTAGIYRAEVEVTFTGGMSATFPNGEYLLVEIVDDLGGAA